MRDHVGYVPQRFDFDRGFPIMVGEFLDLARHTHCPASRLAAKLKEVGLSPTIATERLGNLSGGQMQRVLIAQAILNDTPVPTPIEDAVDNMKVIEAIFHSGESGGWERP